MKISRQVPLHALRVFEAVARLQSFTRAGEELALTQTAVSYQIKLLEDHLGEPVFLRRPRQIVLTEAGERMLPKIVQGLDLLADALASARAPAEEVLLIHSPPTFAQQWLTYNLGRFHMLQPSIAVRLKAAGETIDFDRTPGDIAIRWGRGDWPGLSAHFLMCLDFSPVLSPALAESIGGVTTPADLLKLPIISPTDPWWRLWFAAAGVDCSELAQRPKNDFGIQSLDAGAAMAGQGVAIINPGHYRNEIAAGLLIQPFALTCNDGRDYWLVYPERRRNQPKIKAFRDWILAEMAAEQAAAS
ncbi:LysR family transcriptional regulator [Rhizobium rhizosphaerae]|uniref:LysR family transcriptional regulator n=1 Tax=Xaviernesmea rhizosphaerae TaxID=1672749 RepID=A0ABX3PHM1_9HYPH|nr:LysR substrate-binding domain-containing protein [Xaviernesmea rhizosphaerae]OQP87637.1 LysR family transcriptional regulator [Xaviernesmea rhizosphaerae]